MTRALILLQVEEVTHANMALRDYLRLGGDKARALEARMSPACFAVCAVKYMLAERENPASWLGYMYLFETLTMIMTERVSIVLAAKQFPVAAREFIDTHVKEEPGHMRWVANLINQVTKRYPDTEEAIIYGFDCFAGVYPLPVWNTAYQRAKACVREETHSLV